MGIRVAPASRRLSGGVSPSATREHKSTREWDSWSREKLQGQKEKERPSFYWDSGSPILIIMKFRGTRRPKK